MSNTAVKSFRGVSTILAIGLLNISVTAAAQIIDDQQDAIAVPYKDADLQTASGKADLLRRVRSAAGRLCGEPASRSITEHNMVQQCRDAAVARAQGQLALRQGAPVAISVRSPTP
jgi:UrcA family protein